MDFADWCWLVWSWPMARPSSDHPLGRTSWSLAYAKKPRDLQRANAWLERWGLLAVFLSRTLPGVPGALCIPAGMAAMPFGQFTIGSSMGSLAWCGLLTEAGVILQSLLSKSC